MAGAGGRGRKKIEIKKKEKGSARMVTFSKRRKGLFKKATELHTKTGAKTALCVVSPGGRPYIHAQPSFDAVIDAATKTNTACTTFSSEECCQSYNYNTNITTTEEAGEEKAAYLCKSWLESVRVEACENLEEVIGLLNELEEIREKIFERIAAADELL